MIINHNMSAINTYRQLTTNNTNNAKSLEKLSSGLRINRAGDDAAGLAISEKMRGQIRGLDQAGRNAQDSISMIQTAEGALNETHSILQRMRELAVQAANDTNSTSDRGEIQKEINQLTDEIDRIANTTEFNTQKLIDGSKKGLVEAAASETKIQLNTRAEIGISSASATDLANSGTIIITRTLVSSAAGDTLDFRIDSADASITGAVVNGTQITFKGETIELSGDSLFSLAVGESITISVKATVTAETNLGNSFSMQIGANSGQSILVGINSMKAQDIGVRNADGKSLQVDDYFKATAAVTTINDAIERVSAERSKLGAIQNRLEHTINNLGTSSENLTAAESRIRDVDMAKEMMNFQKNNILSQAAQAMLAQANQQPQGVLQLLR
ncbi:flagellin/flagellar hook associated protein [Desulfitobacterium dehalogenans ATCC 51507]|uniref:Flagellin n=1 Tax=Desulfitobacterium dehalogenans (strain ATCC 51507 / DSM 9161 / JW/IU-DC1) TaxID=756499 RepID=I4ACZ2_DESDJ|nr:flagellin [Desulfitobacterium dehalogenans]AFM01827.1 flagellin/flagellar hook associated protein [Desulfitobacterium dehalogenans ATCC 51507]